MPAVDIIAMNLVGKLERTYMRTEIVAAMIEAEKRGMDATGPLAYPCEGTQLSVARLYGGCAINGAQFTYIPWIGILVRDDVLRLAPRKISQRPAEATGVKHRRAAQAAASEKRAFPDSASSTSRENAGSTPARGTNCLLACPHCGATAAQLDKRNGKGVYVCNDAPSSDQVAWPHVACLECGCGAPSVEAWNRRANKKDEAQNEV